MLSTLVKRLLALRYEVSVTGLEQLDGKTGVLVLPNHPAEIDPVIISTYLWESLRPRPVVIEQFHQMPQLATLMKTIRAIPMPDMDFDAGPYKRRRIEHALDHVVAALKKGDNILMYPSGRLSVTGEERLGGASGVYSILKRHPDVNIAIVRIRGLYGSLFSKAVTGGHTPDLLATLKKASSILLKNLIFLCPKRHVEIEVSLNPSDFPRGGDPIRINRYLERYFNHPTPEQPTLVSHSKWSEKVPLLPERPSDEDALAHLSPEVHDKVINYISRIAEVPPQSITPQTKLGDDLGLDSLTMAELLIWLDREFEASDVELAELVTVSSVLRAAAGHLGTGTPKIEYIVPRKWFERSSERPKPSLATVSTIQEAFLTTAAQYGSHPAMGDDRSGMLTWDELKLKSLFLTRFIARMPGSHIGILFPGSVGSAVVTSAALLARKTAVFLNWTAGKRSIEHAVAATGIKVILTSKSFLDMVPVDLEFIEDKLVFVEDIREQATLWDQLAAKRLARESTQQLRVALGLEGVKPDDTAVVLFTSGSESLPKGVPLTNRNLLSDISGALEVFDLAHTDVLLGFLPAFHSFGLTICTILPLVTGLRVAYHPNPNESRRIARAFAKWGVSLAAGTPTFLRSILKAGTPDLFASARILVSGAERAPSELFEQVSALRSKPSLLEGYGITECSPVVTVNRPGTAAVGVGRPLTGVRLTIIHPETREELPEASQGLILIRGDNVFSGYLGGSPDPFVEHRGERWYNSGDLGYLKDGALVLTGRLKRFIKIGGEMVSLGAIEEALQPEVPVLDGSPTLAVTSKGVEGESRPSIIVFTTGKLTEQRANELLEKSGFPNLVKISEVKRLDQIPVLGTGKTDYQSLNKLGESSKV